MALEILNQAVNDIREWVTRNKDFPELSRKSHERKLVDAIMSVAWMKGHPAIGESIVTFKTIVRLAFPLVDSKAETNDLDAVFDRIMSQFDEREVRELVRISEKSMSLFDEYFMAVEVRKGKWMDINVSSSMTAENRARKAAELARTTKGVTLDY